MLLFILYPSEICALEIYGEFKNASLLGCGTDEMNFSYMTPFNIQLNLRRKDDNILYSKLSSPNDMPELYSMVIRN